MCVCVSMLGLGGVGQEWNGWAESIYGRMVWLRERMNGHELKMSVTTMQDLIKIRNGG